MLILLTTANFPDVMLPAYYENYFYMAFFVIYLLVGLFFLMNLLLASVFIKFKERFERKIAANEERRRL
jgi:two pore calcium channel protein